MQMNMNKRLALFGPGIPEYSGIPAYVHRQKLIKIVLSMLMQRFICRIDVGGKVLTNLLKEWISYRQLNVLEETYVMNECKEDTCYVADNFQKHMQIAR